MTIRLAPRGSSAAPPPLSSRRQFLQAGAAGLGAALVISPAGPAAEPVAGLPLEDFHVHLDNSTIAQVAGLARERGVKFGIVEHAGTKLNKYPVVLSNDAELDRYLQMLAGHPVYRGVQAEWLDWSSCFSPAGWPGWTTC